MVLAAHQIPTIRMDTAFYPIEAQQMSSATLAELLGTSGASYEAFGAGVAEALDCLQHSRRFYDLPPQLDRHLRRFELSLLDALHALEQARASLEG